MQEREATSSDDAAVGRDDGRVTRPAARRVMRRLRLIVVAALLIAAAVTPASAGADTPVRPGFAYVPNLLSSTVSVVDIAAGSVVATIPVSWPFGTAVSPDGRTVYVTSLFGGGTDNGDSVAVIDATTRTVQRIITLGPLGSVQPNGVAVDAVRNKLYVALTVPDALGVVDLTDDSVTQVSVGDNPVGVAIGPRGRGVYVTNNFAGTVSVLDPDTATVTATIPVGTNPAGIEAEHDTRRVFVANTGSATVSVIGRDGSVRTIDLPAGATPEGISVREGRVAVSNVGTGGITLINPERLRVTRTLAVDGSWGIDTARDGRLVVTFAGWAQAGIIRPGRTVTTTNVDVGDVPLGLGRFIARY